MSGPYDQKGYSQPQVNYGMQPGPAPMTSQPYPAHNTVIVQQPVAAMRPVARDWTTDTFGCCEDMGICLCGFFCTPCLACQVASDMGEFACIPCCVPNYLTVMRTKLRTQENIQGTICNDCLCAAFCEPCTLCQLARELKTVKSQRTVYAAQ